MRLSMLINGQKKFPHIIKATKNEPDELPYSRIYENIITDAKETFFIFFNDYVLTDRYETPYIFPKSGNYKEVFYWIIFGNIKDLDIKKFVEDEVIKYKQGKKQEKEFEKLIESTRIQKKLEDQKKHEIKGHGTYFYPPIWIGEFPQQTVEDKLTNQRVRSYVKNIIRTTYKGRILIIQNDGYIAISESDEATAINLLNEIMGTAVINEIGSYVIRKSEIGRMTVDSRSWKFTFYETPQNSKHQILEDDRSKIYKSHDKIWRTPITIEMAESIISTAEKITTDNDIKTFLWLYIESFTFFYNTVYTQSFLMNWFITEKLLKNRCEKINQKINIENYLKDFLENNFWSSDIMIKALRIAEEIDNEEFFYLMDLKENRNCIIHENIKSNYGETDKFRRYCFDKIKQFIKSKLEVSFLVS